MHSDAGVTNDSLAYILGFAFGDGNISKTGFLVRMYDRDQQFVNTTLKQRFVESFGVKPGVSYDRSNNSYVLNKRSKPVWNTLHDLGLPAGRKARIIAIPKSVNTSGTDTKTAFLSGVFDAEGSLTSFADPQRHPRGYDYFEVKMYSPSFVDGLRNLLLDVCDEFRPKVYHYNYGSIIRLNGKGQLGLVSSRLSLMHPRFSPPAR